ncbi:MAG TPA: membrane protein insertion efficiency factor YidD [Thermodesulfobacteriota bacterium]|nr:membrane protein insertion efficiency factor YidD [Thermodesulfobacteriota bacterium]
MIRNALLKIMLGGLRVYKTVSFLLPCACRFYPSCSVYCTHALEKHGIFRGLYLSVKRILRCNPFSFGGYDPVK